MKNKLNFLLVSFMLSWVSYKTVMAQPTNPAQELSFSFYAEPYYSYDFGQPENHNRPGFMYSHNRHNEFNLNLGFVKAAYLAENVRANLALAAGTYMNANYASEPGVMKNVYEANAGIKISKNKNLWLDAGIMPAHIGFESAIGKDNWTVTRGMYAENSPYFETGAKITYTTDDNKWTLSALVLNGWQRINRVDGNNTPAFGHQIIYKPNSDITFNSSSFIGNDKADSIRQVRYFHNLYGIFQLSDKLAFTTGFDIGAEQKSKGNSDYNIWFTPVVIAKFSPSDKINIGLRAEYFKDENGVIISTGTPNGFQTWSYSANIDYFIRENVQWRIEGRGFSSKDKIFSESGNVTNKNFFITTSLTIGI